MLCTCALVMYVMKTKSCNDIMMYVLEILINSIYHISPIFHGGQHKDFSQFYFHKLDKIVPIDLKLWEIQD